jgi:hypothetical protein
MDIAGIRFTTEDKKWVEKIAIAALLIFTVIGAGGHRLDPGNRPAGRA